VQHGRARHDHRLAPVVPGRRAPERREAALDRRPQGRILLEGPAQPARAGLAGHVVGGRTQAAADQHQLGAAGRLGERSGDLRLLVADHRLVAERDAVALEHRGQTKRVGVEPVGRQQLGADRQDRRAHAAMITTSARPAAEV